MTDKYRNTAKGRIAPNGYRLCDPLNEGEILVDLEKKQWIIGKPIGCGGFGEIYLCYEKNDPKKMCVIKVDNLNGPLFVEVHFVIRACQKKFIDSFIERKHLDFLGIPQFIASGTDKNRGYRFLVMERLGEELHKVLEKTHLSIRVTCQIACRIIDCLEYMHEQGYIHADIKAQNILRATVSSSTLSQSKKRSLKRALEVYTNPDENLEEDDRYVLIDYGLAERYTYQGSHKPYEMDKRKANNGTCEFRSRDAHIGVISRRSDIESLGFNIILWFYGRHPWMNMLKNTDHVLEKKKWAMEHIDEFLKESFSDKPLDRSDSSDSKAASASKSKTTDKKIIITPKGLDKFFEAIKKLAHDEKPDYDKLKNILSEIGRLNSASTSIDAKKKSTGALSSAKKTPAKGQKRRSDVLEVEVVNSVTPVKTKKAAGRVPLKRSTNHHPTNGSTNGALNDSDDTEAEEAVELYQPNNKKSAIKRKILAGSVKAVKAINGKKTPPKSRNRIKLVEDSDSEGLLAEAATPVAVKRTAALKQSRTSTRILMMTPPDGGDSPLFGPFEPDDSIKENQDLQSNRNICSKNLSSFLQNSDDDDDTQDHSLRSTRIYINNKRCRPRVASNRATPIRVVNSASTHPSANYSTNTVDSFEENDIKQIISNGKQRIDKSKKSKVVTVNKIVAPKKPAVLNGKTKANGHTSSSTSSSTKSTPAARKNRKGTSTITNGQQQFSTSTPVSSTSTESITTAPVMTAAMLKIRQKIEDKKKSNSMSAKK